MAKTIERIDQFRQHKGISLNAFDASIGRPSGYTGKQLRSNASVGSDILETILRTYKEINPGWLISGEGKMLKSEPEKVAEEPESYPNDTLDKSTALIRNDIKMLSDALYQPMKNLNDGVFKLLLDQQKVLRFIDNIDLDSYNQIGTSLRDFLKEK